MSVAFRKQVRIKETLIVHVLRLSAFGGLTHASDVTVAPGVRLRKFLILTRLGRVIQFMLFVALSPAGPSLLSQTQTYFVSVNAFLDNVRMYSTKNSLLVKFCFTRASASPDKSSV